tara:strand:+ start:351 stop:1115 length:765 start_codon:yes stop_codon:yes gene_type:complete
MRISVFPLVIRFIDFFLDFLNKCAYLYLNIRYFFKKNPKVFNVKNNMLIVLNGPSLKKVLLNSSVLVNKYDIIFVNRGFKHQEYESLKPKFHVFIDSKLLNGQWPIKWIYDIKKINPDVIFVFPINWSSNKKIQKLIKDGIKIHWLKSKYSFSSLGVCGACVELSMNLNYKNIYLVGFDGNGIGYELIRENSHFYGGNEENNFKSLSDYSLDLFSHSRFFRSLIKLNSYSIKKKVNIFNASEGGIITAFKANKL